MVQGEGPKFKPQYHKKKKKKRYGAEGVVKVVKVLLNK
jgi:hypothetical protein